MNIAQIPLLDGTQVEQHRSYLLRYAMLQLRDAGAAEDAVQDTLIAALEGFDRFSGNSSVKTWLTGILKHKIIDHLRRQSREQPLVNDDERSEADAVDALFKSDGHWESRPGAWGNPDQSLENKKFLEALEKCTQNLPAKTARVFMMRDVMEIDTEDICKELGITSTNCWVMLHRARLSLRECLQITWFGKS
ncbi:MAG TPA: sigma-70 family RNA polymerase sigma factor [Burkholderiales bacterium]|nr:sigma-70 family RNA polymerase sigma factor [Burkholderiales bacterium]